jgi:hypothetical protein
MDHLHECRGRICEITEAQKKLKNSVIQWLRGGGCFYKTSNKFPHYTFVKGKTKTPSKVRALV